MNEWCCILFIFICVCFLIIFFVIDFIDDFFYVIFKCGDIYSVVKFIYYDVYVRFALYEFAKEFIYGYVFGNKISVMKYDILDEDVFEFFILFWVKIFFYFELYDLICLNNVYDVVYAIFLRRYARVFVFDLFCMKFS